MKNKGIIYRVTHKQNGKIYVGVSTAGIEERKRDHIKKSKKGKSYAFQHAIATYGPEAFKWEQIDTALTTDELAQKEKEYIIKYDSKENGFNRDSGGGIQKTVYQYSIENGSLVDKYNCLQSAGSAVGADKRSISSAALGVNKTCKGYHWSYFSPTTPTILKDERRKSVIQIDLDGRTLYKYESVTEASKLTGCNKTSIAKVCRGERKSCGGYNWKYL